MASHHDHRCHKNAEAGHDEHDLCGAARALFSSRWPMYWLATTAPPVASAANSTMMRLFIISTRLTPEMAASPQRETIMVSAMPTVTARNCSMSSGPTSRSRSFWENSGVRPLDQPAFSPADAFFYHLYSPLSFAISHLFFISAQTSHFTLSS